MIKAILIHNNKPGKQTTMILTPLKNCILFRQTFIESLLNHRDFCFACLVNFNGSD